MHIASLRTLPSPQIDRQDLLKLKELASSLEDKKNEQYHEHHCKVAPTQILIVGHFTRQLSLLSSKVSVIG